MSEMFLIVVCASWYTALLLEMAFENHVQIAWKFLSVLLHCACGWSVQGWFGLVSPDLNQILHYF